MTRSNSHDPGPQPAKPDWFKNWLALHKKRAKWNGLRERWEVHGVTAKGQPVIVHCWPDTPLDKWLNKCGYVTGEK